MTDRELSTLISSMSLHEKAALCSGLNDWLTKPNTAKGIPALRMADGPHGLRLVDKANRRENGGPTQRATCFPPEVALACSWNPQLCAQVGQAIAQECLAGGVGLLLGPGVNIKRAPLGGRNFEYYSEDPLLSGELAAGFISGLQGAGVGACIKHYAVNNQETNRMSINAAVDERALYDIYLRAFEIAVAKARPASVMASYNRVNGSYATENRRLLTDILRLRFGFSGAVISDWGAVNNRVAGINAGMDLEMPASGGMNDWEIEKAVESGFLQETALDTACWNILRLVFAYSREGRPAPACDHAAHHRLAADALCQSAVLLKNDGALPLKSGGRVAIIGEMAEKPRYQGSGSSVMNPKNLVGFLPAMKAAGHSFVYAPGHRGMQATPGMLEAAVAAAQSAKTVLLFLGLPDLCESEGFDRDSLDLPACQLRLLDTVATANPNVVVVLCCGAPVATPWLGKVRGLLCLHLGGEALGEAAVRLLYGQANPGGKLAETWPLELDDTPARHHFPMGPEEATYNESLFVGYRYYTTAQKPVRFPFGFGLSYTRFAYSALQLQNGRLQPGAPLAFRFTIKNTGALPGAEIAQVYLQRCASATWQPERELLAFRRVTLEPGEETTLDFELPYEALGFHDTTSHSRVVEQGSYRLLVGPSSADTPLQAGFEAEGVVLKPSPAASAGSFYGHITSNEFPDEAFAALYGGKLRSNRPPQRGAYTGTTPLGLMRGSLMGRLLHTAARHIARGVLVFSADKATNRRAADEMARDLPFKNLPLNSFGIISHRAAAALLDACNGQGGLWRFARAMLAKRPYKRR